MAGHSKWKNIQHRKGAQDKKRGKIFTKLLKEITVAVKAGGGDDPAANPRLRSAIQSAKSLNVPKDNIARAIKKGSGADAANYKEVTFEGHGPEGAAIFVECATDNNTRTVANIRSYFKKFNGDLGKNGHLEFLFERKGVFIIPQRDLEEEEFTLEMIDAGAEDIESVDENFEITCTMEYFGQLEKKLHEMKIEVSEGSLQRIPTTTKNLKEQSFATFLKLIDVLEEDDDVQHVYHNVEFDEALLEKLS